MVLDANVWTIVHRSKQGDEMSSAFICTQGTSIANGNDKELRDLAELQRGLQKRHEIWDFECPEFERALDDKLSSMSSDALAHASAELDILSKQGVQSDDRVVLLCSDGYLGRVCGAANKRTIERAFGIKESLVEIVRIPDLQVKDGARLSQFGLKNFIDAARKAIEQYNGPYTVFLCPNGGYKGVVPFLTLLGMQYHCKVLYTFEFSNSVVTLPPLPYVFDRDLYLRARRSLAMLTENVEMREEEYLANIENYEDSERDFFLGFVQYTRPGYVTPSPLVDTFVNESIAMDAMLSKQAFQDLDTEKNGNAYSSFCRLILNSQDSVWRQKNLHTVHDSDLLIIKPCHSTLRLLGFMVGTRYYVARVLQHDAYEQALKTLRKKDFPLETFSQWSPPESLKETGDNLSTIAELLEKNDALKADKNNLRQENRNLSAALEKQEESCRRIGMNLAETVRDLDAEREKNRNLCVQLDAATAQCAELKRQFECCSNEVVQLKEALERLHMKLSQPWYRRLFTK